MKQASGIKQLGPETGKARVKQKRLHLVLRVPRVTRVGKVSYEIIQTHNQVVAEHGEALFAKFGAPLTQSTLEALSRQIEAGVETRLIVVSKFGSQFLGYQSSLTAIYLKDQKTSQPKLVPSYYSRLAQSPSTWFKIDRPFKLCDLTRVALVSNKRPLFDVVVECRTPTMLVEDV